MITLPVTHSPSEYPVYASVWTVPYDSAYALATSGAQRNLVFYDGSTPLNSQPILGGQYLLAGWVLKSAGSEGVAGLAGVRLGNELEDP